MRRVRLVLLSSLLIAANRPASAEVVVSFVHAERFTDASMYGGYGLKAEQPALTALAQFIEGLGGRYLGADKRLVIEVTNIDLAGQFEPWRAIGFDVRVMRDIYPPRITLRYQLTEGTRILTAGEESLVDINYLSNPAVRFVQDPLRYEKAMVSDWFRAKLLVLPPPAGS